MNTRLLALSVSILLFVANSASPTTVIPPSFDEMVSQARAIFLGEAVDSRSEWEDTPQGRSIITIVTFDVTRVLKGNVGARTDLTFLGGTIGDLTLRVADMPQFRVGDRDVLFVSPEVDGISPLVGFSYGRYRVLRDSGTGTDRVFTHDGRPVASAAPTGRPLAVPLPTALSLTFTEFESLVQRRIASQRKP